MKFPDMAREWLLKKSESVKPTTLSAYRYTVERALIPAFAEACCLTEEAVRSYVAQCAGAGLSRATIRNRVIMLKQIARHGHRHHGWPPPDWELRYPPPARVRLPALDGQSHRRLLRYLAAQPSPADIGVGLALMGGLRIGEALALCWDDVDFRRRTITVRRTCGDMYDPATRRTIRHEGVAKTLNSRRDVPAGRELLSMLKAVRRQEGPEAVYVVGGRAWPRSVRGYRAYFRRLLRRLVLPPVPFHGLRHSFATRAIEAGCDVKTVSSILGHSNVAITLNLYVHPTDGQKLKAVERLSEFINNPKHKREA